MFQRIAPAARSLLRTQAVQPLRRHAHGFKPETEIVQQNRTTLSDIPIPSGSWAEYHSKRNGKWNMYLAASIAFFVLTTGVMVKEGVWYLHTTPPMKNK